MRYLKSQNEYKSKLIVEAVEDAFGNSITFGGSMLGRLINSTLRKLKIGYKYTRVNNLVNLLENQLDELLNDHKNMSEKEKNDVNHFLTRKILEEIYKVSTGSDTEEKKIDILLGTQTNEGLIDSVITVAEKLDHSNKEELIKKLNDFKDDLLKLRKEFGGEESGEDKEVDSEESSDDPRKNFYQNSKSLLLSISQLHLDIKNNTVKFSTGVDDNVGVKSNTFFDDKKYQQQRDSTVEEISKKIQLAKQAVTVYTTKGNKERVNFYKNEISKYQSKLGKTKGGKSIPDTKIPHDNNLETSTGDAKGQAEEDTSSGESGVEKSKEHELQTASYRFNEASASLRDNEEHARIAWKKVINAYTKSGIAKYISYIDSLLNDKDVNKIKENRKIITGIGRQVVLNETGIGKPIAFDDLIKEDVSSVSDISKSISLFGRILLSFSEDTGILGSYGDTHNKDGKSTGGAGSNIKMFINSFSELKKSYPLLKKESVLNFSIFSLIKEAEESNVNLDDSTKSDTADKTNGEDTPEKESVKKSWFKFFDKGEEEKWETTDKDKKLNQEVEKSYANGVNINMGNPEDQDHIIAIINIFGKAYDLYATEVIPSGRPGGRVSQKTLREYEYIGAGSPSTTHSAEGIIPGNGPWASKIVYDKWQNGVTKLLENKQYRRILANSKFISEAESSTDTPIGGGKKPGSGKTLLLFINDMLNNDKGSFKAHRRVIIEKYFGADTEGIKGKVDDKVGLGTIENKIIADSDKGEIDKPIFIDARPGVDTLDMADTVLKIETTNEVYVISTFHKHKDKDDYILFRYQESSKTTPMESMITTYLKGQMDGKDYKTDGLGMHYDANREYYIGAVAYDFKKSDNHFKINEDFTFKFMKVGEELKDFVKNPNRVNDIKSKFKDKTITIKNIQQLVVPVEDKKGKQSNKVIRLSKVQRNSQNDIIEMGTGPNKNLIEELKK